MSVFCWRLAKPSRGRFINLAILWLGGIFWLFSQTFEAQPYDNMARLLDPLTIDQWGWICGHSVDVGTSHWCLRLRGEPVHGCLDGDWASGQGGRGRPWLQRGGVS